jgi:hypothetical protein
MTRGTLKPNEYHPAADIAMAYMKELTPQQLMMWSESFAGTALSGNRLAEICSETLSRLQKGEPVSDRYLLGLAFTILHGEQEP